MENIMEYNICRRIVYDMNKQLAGVKEFPIWLPAGGKLTEYMKEKLIDMVNEEMLKNLQLIVAF
jgi:hypothetical protein